MEEMLPNVRESLDRKQENMRRRRRRDTLRVQLMKVFNTAATAGTFALRCVWSGSNLKIIVANVY